MKIYNMTQHSLLPSQLADGLLEFPDETQRHMRELMTFEELPEAAEIDRRAEQMAAEAAERGAEGVMIGGAPYLMPALRAALKARGVRAFYAFSLRRSVDRKMPDGTMEKHACFQYLGLVEY